MSDVPASRRPRGREATGSSSDEDWIRGLGIALVVPGWTQWLDRERERGGILFGTFSSALFVGLCAWGTWMGWVLLGFAFAAHVFATADALSRGTFPPFERWVPWLTASLGLGLGCYVPFLIVGSLFAWPGMDAQAPWDGYLVDRWTLKHRAPRTGDHVWVESTDGRGPWLGRVVAVPGQTVEWSSENKLRIDGEARPHDRRVQFPGQVGDVKLLVPNDHLLIIADGPRDPGASDLPAPRMIPSSRIVGRAWAQYYPVWERRLL